jgi:hypothetical protein
MLPAILQEGDGKSSIQGDKASGEIATMLTMYANLAGTTAEGKEAATKAATEIKASAGTARPVLEVSHESWCQYRKREGQPMDMFLASEKGVEVDESGAFDFLKCCGIFG